MTCWYTVMPRASKKSRRQPAKPEQTKPFWQTKSLQDMTKREWESLCDGCGKCCLNKYETHTGRIRYTDVACTLLNLCTARCSNYKQRSLKVPDCIQLTADNIAEMTCLPKSCAYRRLHEGRGLPDWHPLLTGDPKSVETAGMSVKGRCISEDHLSEEDISERLVDWPMA